MINLGRQHLVCVSNVFAPPGVIDVYDSMPAYSTKSFQLQTQVVAILRTQNSAFELRHVDVQRQIGFDDCALFSIANAITLCMKRDPHTVSYIQTAMR